MVQTQCGYARVQLNLIEQRGYLITMNTAEKKSGRMATKDCKNPTPQTPNNNRGTSTNLRLTSVMKIIATILALSLSALSAQDSLKVGNFTFKPEKSWVIGKTSSHMVKAALNHGEKERPPPQILPLWQGPRRWR